MSRQYQDQWVQGRAVSKGYRPCADRYAQIAVALPEELPRPFTVLDLGADRAYFSLRLAEDFGAECLAVNREPIVAESVAMNPGTSVTARVEEVTADTLSHLGTFDVVLALSILHHFPHTWRAMIDELERMARWCVFIEAPAPDEPVKVRDGDRFEGLAQEVARRGRLIGQGPAVFGGTESRGIYRIDTHQRSTP